jgi:predicted aspartyl protease
MDSQLGRAHCHQHVAVSFFGIVIIVRASLELNMKRKFYYVFVACLFASLCGSIAHSQNKSDIVEVPFTFERSSVIVQVKVNGKASYNMLLDTGAEQSAIDLNTAKELGLKLNPLGGGKAVATGNKENTIYLTTLSQIEISNLMARDILAATTDFSRISQRIGIPVNGVVGYNFLKNRIVQFDYAKRVVRFYAKSPIPKPQPPNTASRMVLPFRFYEGDKFPVIDEVYVNGKRIKAELDTGHSGVLALTATAIKRLGLEAEEKTAEPETSEGALGTSVNRKGRLRTLTVGAVTIDAPSVSFRAANSGLDQAPFDGLLGNDFFKDFIVTFDYRSMLVMFEKS